MSVKIRQEFIPAGRRNRPGLAMTPRWITIHDTGNDRATANAINTSHWVRTAPDLLAGWHFTVDDTVIIQQLPLNENGWHASDGYNGNGNRKSIGVEICENRDGNRARAEENAAWLAARLIKEIPSLEPFPACMKQHWHWNNQHPCPRVLRGRPGGWEGFLTKIEIFLRQESDDMLENAIVLNSIVDFAAAEPLALRLQAPIYMRDTVKAMQARNVYVIGGGKDGIPGQNVIDLSGRNRYETAQKIYSFLEGLAGK